MLLSRTKKYLFVHIYKNAWTSITHALKHSRGKWERTLEFVSRQAGYSYFDPHPYHGHISASELISLMGERNFRSHYSFAFVRNPWDWQVSLYKYMLKKTDHHQHALAKRLGSFEEYIKWRCENEVKLQKDFIYSRDEKLLVNYVGRFENIDSDFDLICTNIGFSNSTKPSLPKLNTSNSKPYQEYYNDKTRLMVERAFEPDIRLLEYEFC